MLYTTLDNFYLSKEELQNSPSRNDGIDEDIENQLRVYGCQLVAEAGILLRLKQAVMATGQVLFHRFYCKKSFVQYNVQRVASACIWLASKLEEDPRKPRDVLSVMNRILRRREGKPIAPLDIYSKKYDELKSEIIRTERYMLRAFGFIMHVDHPHKFVLNYLEMLTAPKELFQEAWNLTNDSLRTTLCVRFKAEVVACGVIHLAARRRKVPLPEKPIPWWEIFTVDKLHLLEVCRVILNLYKQPVAEYVPVWKDPKAPATSGLTQASPISTGIRTTADRALSQEPPIAASAPASVRGPASGGGIDGGNSSDQKGSDRNAPSLNQQNETSSQRKRERNSSDRETNRESQRDKDKANKRRSRSRERRRDKDRDRERQRHSNRDRDSDRDRGRGGDRYRPSKGRELDRGRCREPESFKHNGEKVRDSFKSKDRDKELNGERARDRDSVVRDRDSTVRDKRQRAEDVDGGSKKTRSL